ncbi:MAG: hypothetical protein A3F47_02000 [Candidatus Staskawiczbacteria bacterium RIFCSPHIGHO2_12_FULL_38_11]|uniref:Uncharacterized protein n=1 Tax=Candidatus Staskawiczbacteria bacterium RIFCSPHIGHO2_12_FULL_38_11 TaxID=1802209 RepID=A0A1G2I4N8_9BACT|nr:MAG: hypothetical protein A3F47_02000 [Candidatus Staskawiczbacteria bacterium RIFCSPHIGHO2_12_FULL_38_11]
MFFFAFAASAPADPQTDATLLKKVSLDVLLSVEPEYEGVMSDFKAADSRIADLMDRLKKWVPPGADYTECEDLIFSGTIVVLLAATNVNAATTQWEGGEDKRYDGNEAFFKEDWVTAASNYQAAIECFAACSVYCTSPGYAKDQLKLANDDFLDCAETIIGFYEKK